MAGLPGLEEVRSISRAGISVVTLAFADSAELYFARQLVGERVAEARRNIPERYGAPQLGPVSSGLGEVFHFEVKGDSIAHGAPHDPRLADRAAPQARARRRRGEHLRRRGARASSSRSTRGRWRRRGVGVAEVSAAIERTTSRAAAPTSPTGARHVTVRAEGRIRSAKDLGEVVVERKAARTPLYVKDLGDDRRGAASSATARSRATGARTRRSSASS